jgi:hypothetical protein
MLIVRLPHATDGIRYAFGFSYLATVYPPREREHKAYETKLIFMLKKGRGVRLKFIVPHTTKLHPYFKSSPVTGRAGPEGSRKLRLPDFLTTAQYCGRLSASRTGRLYPQEYSCYSFSLGPESTTGPWFGRKEICHWKIQWHHREWIPGPSD